MAEPALALDITPPPPAPEPPRPTRAVVRLITLLAAASGVTPRWDLADALEGGQAVTDDRLRKLVERARRVLGSDAIENVWGRGYRLTEAGRAAWTRVLGQGA